MPVSHRTPVDYDAVTFTILRADRNASLLLMGAGWLQRNRTTDFRTPTGDTYPLATTLTRAHCTPRCTHSCFLPLTEPHYTTTPCTMKDHAAPAWTPACWTWTYGGYRAPIKFIQLV